MFGIPVTRKGVEEFVAKLSVGAGEAVGGKDRVTRGWSS